MTGSEQTRLSRLFEIVPQGAAMVAVVVGILVLFGWVFDVALLRSAFSGLVAMKANTAAGFILAGASLWTAGARRRLPRIVSRSCAGAVLLLGLLVLAEYLSGADFGIDQLLVRDLTSLPGDIPGRMAVSTAFCFAALGGALVLLSREKGGSVLAVHGLATVPILVAGAALVSYGYDLEAFLRIKLNYTPMALHTAAVFVVLGLGIVSARPEYPFRRILTSDSAAGSTVRRLLPAAVGLQLVMGWLLLRGLQAGHLSEAVSLALFAVANIGGLGALIQWNAVRLDQADAQRRLAEGALRKSAEEIEDLYNRAPIGYHSVDKDGTLVRINDTELAWLGYTREEMVGRMNFADLLTPESLKTFRETFAESKTRGWVHGLEYDLIRKDGTILPVLLNATAVRDAQGNFVMSRSTMYDITERKQNEAVNAVRLHLVQFSLTHSLDELLEETLNQTEKLTGSLIGFYHFVEEDQNSLTLQTWSTRTKAEFCKATGKGLHYPIAEAGVWADCVRQGKPVIHNDYAALPNRKGMPEGHAQVIREVVVPVRRGQKLSAILGVGNKPTDYTEKDVESLLMIADLTGEIAARKRAEEALRAASSYTRSLIEASPDPLVTISAEGKVTDVNDATIRATGVSREELIGSDFSNYFTEPDKARAGYQEVFAKGFVTDYPLALRHASGSVMEVLYNATVFRNDAGEVQGVFAAARDITKRKQAEDALKHASAYTRSLIEASLDPLVTISAEGKVTDVNEATIRATGVSREALLGSDFSSYFTEPDKARAGYQEVFAKGVVTDYPLALRHASGSVMEVLYNASVYRNEKGEVAGVFAAARDVTRARRAEKLLRERVKELEAFYHLSELAARKEFPLDSLCQELANVLPGSWQYPETACARIVIDESEFRTANFGISKWMQAAPIKVLGEVVGKVEVGYLEQKPEEDEGPFLKEERQLIEAIAERVGQIAELKRAEVALQESEERFRAIFDWVNDAIFIHDMATGAIVDVNRRMCEMYGYSRDEALKHDIDAFSAGTPPYTQQDALQWLAKAARGEPQTFEWLAKDTAGRLFWVEVAMRSARLAGKDRILVSVRDISERKQAEQALQESEERYRSLVAALFEGVMLMGADGAIRASNTSAEQILGLTVEQMAGRTSLDPRWRAVHEDGSPFPGETHPAWVTLQTGEACHNVIMGVHKPDGSLTWISINSQPLYGPGNAKPYAVVASFADITERKLLEQELQRQALTDPLTGAANRRHFQALAEQELHRFRRFGHPLSLLMVDIDHFKQVNDSFGHQVGDLVLQHLVQVCRNALRDIDTIARVGGEEFVALLPETGPERALQAAERLRRAVETTEVANERGEAVRFTVSIGVATLRDTDGSIETAVGRADHALYQAKETGRNRVCCEEAP